MNLHHTLRSLLPLGLALALSACALGPLRSEPPVRSLFDDAAFVPPTEAIDASSVLAFTPAMRAYFTDHVQPRIRYQGERTALLDALYHRDALKLRYDTDLTRTASGAFDARAGNCLSLVLMTAAFAREAGLPVQFQSVRMDDALERSGDLLLFVGHVNIALGAVTHGVRLADMLPDWTTVDFLPSADLHRQRHTPITEQRVLAMYMNNRAAETLALGRVNDAYWWAREALQQDPAFQNAHNTLGVIYLRHGQPQRAEQAMRRALDLAPDDPHTLGNLALALRQQGRVDEAQAMSLRQAALQKDSPFGRYELGQQALSQGDLPVARAHFEWAVQRQRDNHEFHLALAQVLALQGDVPGAERELGLARDNSSTQRLQSLYAGKLQRLRDLAVH
jgi:Tfp pilus assembly protein PilF